MNNKCHFFDNLQRKVQQVCPQGVEVSIKITDTPRTRGLLIIRFSTCDVDIDHWAIETVSPLFWKIEPILKAEQAGFIRPFFCQGNDFVLYPSALTSGIFADFQGIIVQNCYGSENYRHYVVESHNINEVINFLLSGKTKF